jgi:beta-lactamase regulating signal transducer with metallopeptidase domain
MGIIETLAWNALEASALALALLGATRLLKLSAPLRHALWLLVLAKLLLPPVAVGRFGLSEACMQVTGIARDFYRPAPADRENRPLEDDGDGGSRAGEELDAGMLRSADRLATERTTPSSAGAFSAVPEEASPEDIPSSPWSEEAEEAAGLPVAAPALETQPGPPAGAPSSDGIGRDLLGLAVIAVWLAGSLFAVGRHVLKVAALRAVLARSARPAPAEVTEAVRDLASRLGLRRAPRVLAVGEAIPPMVWALGKPLVLLPQDLVRRLDPVSARGLLAHELAHIRRRDHWTSWIELAAACLYWWLPTVRWARKRMRIAADESADAWAVWALGERKTYAESLLEVVGLIAAGPRPAVGMGPGLGERKAIERRLSMIMRQKLERRMTWPALVAFLLTGLLVLPAAPDRAGAQAPQAPAPEVKPPSTALPDTPPADPVGGGEEPKSPATSEEVKTPPTPPTPVVVNPLSGFELQGGPIEIRGVDGGTVEMRRMDGKILRARTIRIDRDQMSATGVISEGPASASAPSDIPGQPPRASPGIRSGGPPHFVSGSYFNRPEGAPSSLATVTSQEHRLQNLEAKIDRVLNALEALQSKPSTTGGGSMAGFRATPGQAGGAPISGRATGVSGKTSGGKRTGRISSAQQRPSTAPAQEPTPEQQALIESLDAEFQAKMEPLEAQMQALEQQYEETILKILEKAPATGEPERPASRRASRPGLSPATGAPTGGSVPGHPVSESIPPAPPAGGGAPGTSGAAPGK